MDKQSAYTLTLPAEEWHRIKLAAAARRLSIRAWAREVFRTALDPSAPHQPPRADPAPEPLAESLLPASPAQVRQARRV